MDKKTNDNELKQPITASTPESTTSPEEAKKRELEERKRKAFMNAASNFICDGFD